MWFQAPMQKCTFVAGTCCSECLYRLVRKSECTALWRLRDAGLDRVGLEGQNLQVCLGVFFVGEVIMILSEMFARLPEVSQSRKVMF